MYGKKYRSVSSYLRETKGITEEFEVMLNTLQMEEIIQLRLELAAKSVKGKIYHLRLWKLFKTVAYRCFAVFAYMYSSSYKEMSMILGISNKGALTLTRRYRLHHTWESPLTVTEKGEKTYGTNNPYYWDDPRARSLVVRTGSGEVSPPSKTSS